MERHVYRTIPFDGILLLAMLAAVLTALCVAACAPLPDIRNLAVGDLRPPELLSASAVAPRKVRLVFDESAVVDPKRIFLSPEVEVSVPAEAANSVVIELKEALGRGQRYMMEAFAADRHGNGLGFVVPVYGYNPNVPRLVINELVTRGSSSHPDLVELAVLSGGNLAGVCLSVGTPRDWSERIVLPNLEVRSGQFVLIHCKPQGVPEEINETAEMTASGGLDSCNGAWDFWMGDGTGLSGNNGVLTLTSSPDGPILDAVVYSNRTSNSDEKYRGFGSSAMMMQVDELVKQGAWAASAQLAAPEDAVNTDGSTSTRSICRSSTSVDTNKKQDWHIVPTRGSTFGSQNTDDIYVP